MTETLVDVSPSSKEAEPQPSAEELDAARELVRQARARGVALTGPDGLLKALTKTVIETARDLKPIYQGVNADSAAAALEGSRRSGATSTPR
jgi:putative transposase